jgi:hypothetical protein
MATMKIRVIIALAFLLSARASQAQGKPPVFREVPPPPDHLVPIDPFPDELRQRFRKLYRETLYPVHRHDDAVLIIRPSFDPDESLVIRSARVDPDTYTLIHTKVNRNIWYSMAEHNIDRKAKALVTTRREVPFPTVQAERARRLWVRMLERTRYVPLDVRNPFMGVDGTTLEFEYDMMFAECRDPVEGETVLLLADLGLALIHYCSVAEDKRAAALKEVDEKCLELERRLGKP